MVCKKCGFENNEEAKFCANCGNKLVEEKKDNNLCTTCGYQNTEGAKFCANCGRSLEAVEATYVDENHEVRCPVCGANNKVEAEICALCGSNLKEKHNVEFKPNPAKGTMKDGKSVSLILGIISIVSVITCGLFPVAIVCGIIAIILGIISCVKIHGLDKKALIGMILSAVAIVISIIIIVSLIAVFNDPEFQAQIKEILEQEGIQTFINITK